MTTAFDMLSHALFAPAQRARYERHDNFVAVDGLGYERTIAARSIGGARRIAARQGWRLQIDQAPEPEATPELLRRRADEAEREAATLGPGLRQVRLADAKWLRERAEKMERRAP